MVHRLSKESTTKTILCAIRRDILKLCRDIIWLKNNTQVSLKNCHRPHKRGLATHVSKLSWENTNISLSTRDCRTWCMQSIRTCSSQLNSSSYINFGNWEHIYRWRTNVCSCINCGCSLEKNNSPWSMHNKSGSTHVKCIATRTSDPFGRRCTRRSTRARNANRLSPCAPAYRCQQLYDCVSLRVDTMR